MGGKKKKKGGKKPKKKEKTGDGDEEAKNENEEFKVELPKFGWVKIKVSNDFRIPRAGV